MFKPLPSAPATALHVSCAFPLPSENNNTTHQRHTFFSELWAHDVDTQGFHLLATYCTDIKGSEKTVEFVILSLECVLSLSHPVTHSNVLYLVLDLTHTHTWYWQSWDSNTYAKFYLIQQWRHLERKKEGGVWPKNCCTVKMSTHPLLGL